MTDLALDCEITHGCTRPASHTVQVGLDDWVRTCDDCHARRIREGSSGRETWTPAERECMVCGAWGDHDYLCDVARAERTAHRQWLSQRMRGLRHGPTDWDLAEAERRGDLPGPDSLTGRYPLKDARMADAEEGPA